MNRDRPALGNLTGSLLIAHPSLLDPNFRRTILFLSHHDEEDGAVGLVLNRPLANDLGAIKKKHSLAVLQDLDFYYGGPVATDQVTVASLQWRENPTSVAFHSFMGQIEDIQIGPEWQNGLRAFVGYSGWTKGQLENEISQNAWLVLQPSRPLIEMDAPQEAWRDFMRQSGPLLKLLAEAPDDPSRN